MRGESVSREQIHPQLASLAMPVEALTPDPKNARRHDERNVDSIAESLREHGQRKPIVAQKVGERLVVRAGNGTLEAARKLGWERLAVVVVDEGDREATRYALRDNRTAELAEWDDEALRQALRECAESEAEIAALGWNPDEFQVEASAALDMSRDETPEPPAEPTTKPGDLWLLGNHRLLCGDSTKAEDVEKLMGGAEPSLMITDPPYGVEYDPGWRSEAAEAGHLAYAASRIGEVTNDDRVDWSEAWSLSPAHVVYCWHAGLHASRVQSSLESAGYEMRSQIIWAKSNFPISRGHYHWRHEPCWYAVRKGKTAGWIGDRKQTTLWEINLDRNVDGGHSTQKPVECMERPIRNHEGDVHDPFLGSGTTLIACEKLGRKCYGMEISPAYCDAIVKRWETLTGKKARLEGAAEETS